MIFNILFAGLSLMTIGDTVEVFDNTLETILETVELDETVDISELIEHLEIYLHRPLNLNTATISQLEELRILNDFQIAALLQYRSDFGDLADIFELHYVPGFTPQIIAVLQPYISFRRTENFNLTWANIRRFGRSDLMLRYTRGLNERHGYSSSIIRDSTRKNAWYLGSPDVLWMRYQFNAMNKLRIGFVARKNAGEEFFKGSQKQGFPFYSGFLAISDVGRIKNLVVGNYQLQFGQGLSLWSGFSLGKSVDGSTIKKRAQGVRPFTSSARFGYFQGVASTLKFGQIDVSAFFSYRNLDATVSEFDENGNPQSISSIIEAVNHRTIGELERKNTAGQILFGTHIDRHWSRFRIGATAHYNSLDVDYLPRIRPDNQFTIPPKENISVGLDWEGIGRISRYYGEFAMSKNGAKAFIAGSRFLLNQRLSAHVSARYYDRNYQNFFADGLSEGSRTANEKGLFVSLYTELSRAWKVAIMTDIFEFPWLSYSSNEPVFGQEYQFRVFFTPNSRLSVYAHYRYKTRESVVPNTGIFTDFAMHSRQSLRLHIDHKISENMTLKNRLEYGFSNNNKGFMVYQDVQYRFQKIPLSATFRYAVYDTDNFDMRIFVYENDVLFGSTLQSYFYKGSRFFVLLQYRPVRNLTFWLKYSNTNIADRNTIGSGLEEIEGRDRAEIRFQVRWRF
ncbi:MAG: helix-hairpin-helix domain-containing protein [Bacteroidales bacterium]|nr:helix-hairpin-helix domain-containing protein [Bacteroidales bacterium]